MDTLSPPATGTRVLLPDGSAKTVLDTTRSDDGHLWLHLDGGSANRADRCEPVDTSRITEARQAARRAAHAIRVGGDIGQAADELGDALRYLAQADPDAFDELTAGAPRVTIEIPRLGVIQGDILHQHGARLTVLRTAVSTSDTPQWWAEVHGVTAEDRQATYRAPWHTGIHVQYAAWDLVTVERAVPA
ncbi:MULTISPECIES: hypothetical protein [unclassified Streptomyces]|uniref:hypothetical protein n=1 Tax=unclassified Streptomyces TaxID=2593676 RepID=UPI00093D084F|nr:hypothetical protein [Streptomyces sp. TSRI0281]OKI34999.1 hypothetical protein A6A29_16370 [Streptomyces sp. TSRI0281]